MKNNLDKINRLIGDDVLTEDCFNIIKPYFAQNFLTVFNADSLMYKNIVMNHKANALTMSYDEFMKKEEYNTENLKMVLLSFFYNKNHFPFYIAHSSNDDFLLEGYIRTLDLWDESLYGYKDSPDLSRELIEEMDNLHRLNQVSINHMILALPDYWSKK